MESNNLSTTTRIKKEKKSSKQQRKGGDKSGKKKKKQKKTDPEGVFGNEIFDYEKQLEEEEGIGLSGKNDYDDGLAKSKKISKSDGRCNQNYNNNNQLSEHFQVEKQNTRVEMRPATTSLTSSTSTNSTAPQHKQQQQQDHLQQQQQQQQPLEEEDGDSEDMPFFVKQRPLAREFQI